MPGSSLNFTSSPRTDHQHPSVSTPVTARRNCIMFMVGVGGTLRWVTVRPSLGQAIHENSRAKRRRRCRTASRFGLGRRCSGTRSREQLCLAPPDRKRECQILDGRRTCVQDFTHPPFRFHSQIQTPKRAMSDHHTEISQDNGSDD